MMHPGPIRILFIKHLNASFIRRDEQLLNKIGQVTVFQLQFNKGWRVIPELFKETWFILRRLRKTEIIYVWFADFHAVLPAFLARIFQKKCFIVIGGVDAAYLPEYAYGTKTRLAGRLSVWLATKLAHLLLPVSNFTAEALCRNINPVLRNKSLVIYNCFEPIEMTVQQNKAGSQVVSICLANKIKTLYIKGIDFYLTIAEKMPEVQFAVVGLSGEALEWAKERAPNNLHLHQPMPFGDLQQYLTNSQVICQFSRHEAFGLALLEGIAAGCFPVGLNLGGTAEILQLSEGILIEKLDISEAVTAIRLALTASPEKKDRIKKQVLSRFNCKHRLDALAAAIDKISQSASKPSKQFSQH